MPYARDGGEDAKASPLSITMAALSGRSRARRLPSLVGSIAFSNFVSFTGKIFAGGNVLESGGASIGSSVAEGAMMAFGAAPMGK